VSYYRVCPHCGAHLDPREVCDCGPSKSQSSGDLKKELPASSAKADGGKGTQRSN